MQFYFLSPILLIPLWRKPKYGFVLGAMIYTLLTFIIGFLVVHYHLPPTHVFISAPDIDMTTWFYDMPYVRFQPYLIGIFFGYLFYKTKNMEVKIPHVINFILWQLSLVTMFAVVFGLAGLRKNETPNGHTWTVFESVMYNCFHKTGWSLALGWIVFSCHKGYGGLIDDFLSWKAFVPLSKLTYGAYLSHIVIQFMVFFTQTSPIYFSDFLMSQYFMGIACFTFGTAFVQSLVAESPFVRLEKILLGGAAKPKKPNPKPKSELPNGHVNIAADVPPKEQEKATEIPATKATEIIVEESKIPNDVPPKEQEKAETATEIPATKATEIIAEESKIQNDVKTADEEITKTIEPQISATSTRKDSVA